MSNFKNGESVIDWGLWQQGCSPLASIIIQTSSSTSGQLNTRMLHGLHVRGWYYFFFYFRILPARNWRSRPFSLSCSPPPLFFPIYQVCTEWNRCTWSDFNKKRHTHTKRTGLEFISHLWSMGNKLCPETSSRCTERLNAWTLLHLLGGSTLMSQRIQIVTCLFVFVG